MKRCIYFTHHIENFAHFEIIDVIASLFVFWVFFKKRKGRI